MRHELRRRRSELQHLAALLVPGDDNAAQPADPTHTLTSISGSARAKAPRGA